MMQRILKSGLCQMRGGASGAWATSAIRPASSIDCSSHGDGDSDIVHLPDSTTLTIPVYPDRPDELLATRKARLVYQSRKRGMLENDLLLSTFAAKYLAAFSAEQTHQFDSLINKPSNDWDIFYWATNKKPTPPEYENEIMQMLREHVVSKDRQRRMPDL